MMCFRGSRKNEAITAAANGKKAQKRVRVKNARKNRLKLTIFIQKKVWKVRAEGKFPFNARRYAENNGWE